MVLPCRHRVCCGERWDLICLVVGLLKPTYTAMRLMVVAGCISVLGTLASRLVVKTRRYLGTPSRCSSQQSIYQAQRESAAVVLGEIKHPWQVPGIRPCMLVCRDTNYACYASRWRRTGGNRPVVGFVLRLRWPCVRVFDGPKTLAWLQLLAGLYIDSQSRHLGLRAMLLLTLPSGR